MVIVIVDVLNVSRLILQQFEFIVERLGSERPALLLAKCVLLERAEHLQDAAANHLLRIEESKRGIVALCHLLGK